MKEALTTAPEREPAAIQNHETLCEACVVAIALVGPPGAGKTALIEATARQLKGKANMALIAINPAADRDADRVSRYCEQVCAVKTAVPDAEAFGTALRQIDLDGVDILLIESMGGIAGAPDFGQDATVAVLAVSGGDDKAAEYAQLLRESPVLILSKAELQRHVTFDRGAFRADLRQINPQAELMEISAFENTGLNRWIAWLDCRRQAKNPAYHPPVAPTLPPEWFVG